MCIDLALVFKCSPFVFMERSPEVVRKIYDITSDRLELASRGNN